MPPAPPPGGDGAAKDPPPATSACGTADQCFDAASKADEAGDEARARELYASACDQGHGAGCNGLAFSLPDERKAEQLPLFEKACKLGNDGIGMAPDGTACLNAAERLRTTDPVKAIGLYERGCGEKEPFVMACERGALHAYEHKAFPTALALGKKVCGAESVAGCNLLGVMHAKGEGTPTDLKDARDYFAKGCEGGDAEACSNVEVIDDANEPLEVPGANITMGSVTADGLTATDLVCRSDGSGLSALMAGPIIVGGLAKKKAKLAKCSPNTKPRVHFTTKAGKVTEVEVDAVSATAQACLVKVLKSAASAFDGQCAITLELGK